MSIINTISICVIPAMFLLIILFGLYKKVNIYECFIEGAKSGIENTVRILPPLVALLVAISMFRASGALDSLIFFLSPITKLLHIPPQIMPLALMRPISGSGALAIVTDNLKNFGPDSYIGRLSSIVMGSTETTLYTIAVYFGAVYVKNTRHTLAAGLIADVTGLIAGVFICSLFFK